VKSVSQPDTIPILGYNYLFQMTETGFAESFRPLTGWGLHRLSENLSEYSLMGDLSNDNIVNPPHFSLVNTFKQKRVLVNLSQRKVRLKCHDQEHTHGRVWEKRINIFLIKRNSSVKWFILPFHLSYLG
jgi:hypothetical protein